MKSRTRNGGRLHILAGAFAIGVIAAASIAASSNAQSPATQSMVSAFSANNEPVRDSLLRLGRQVGFSVVVEGDVQGRVSVSLRHVSVGQALDAILLPLGYRYRVVGGVIIVMGSRAAPADMPAPSPTPAPAVLAISVIPVDRAASMLRGMYPRDKVSIDRDANAIIVVGPADDIVAMRAVIAGVDVANPLRRTAEAIQVRFVDAHVVALKLQPLFPSARISSGPNHSLVVAASPLDMSQIKSVVASLDQQIETPAPTTAPAEAVRVSQASPVQIARTVEREYPAVRAAVAGSSVVLTGTPDAVANAKALIALIDQPAESMRFTQVYRLHSVDAKSVGDLISRSFRDAVVTADEDLNALSVTATASEQQRIADAIAQLDVASAGPGTASVAQPGSSVNAGVGPGGTTVEVVTLKAAIPGANLAPSTSATDLATAVTQALQQSAPDLHITVPNNSTQLILTGSPFSIRLAKQLIDQLDVSPPQVVLDTEVLELDETGQKNLGLVLPSALSTTYSEIPPVSAIGGTPPPLLGIQPWTRTALSGQVVLNALLTVGHARVLADPRVTTISGHTASIRAGDQLNYTTSVVNGGAGSVVTQQVQSVQTGVTLDITPVVNAGNTISVTLHPTVNSLLGTNQQGVPSIANREAQTTVTLADNETLVIGGLIQEDTSRTETTVPILGQIPLIGRLFRNYTYNTDRNELIIVVTPHILLPGAAAVMPGPALPSIPTPAPLPTLAPGTLLPTPGAMPQPLGVALNTPPPSAATEPLPTPTAFAQTNVFRYGQAPSNTYAGQGDPPQIFFALFSPTVLRNGSQATISVVTTSNVSRVTIGSGGYLTSLSQIAPDKWQASFTFSASSFSLGSPSSQLTLTAYRSDGAAATIQVPISISP